MLSLLFPDTCLVCGKLGTVICAGCWKELHKQAVFEHTCFYCNKKSYRGMTHPACARQKGIDGCCFFYYYTPAVKAILSKCKYYGTYAALSTIMQDMHPCLMAKLIWIRKDITNGNNWYIQPVPLHHRRLSKRGYNQSGFIARAITQSTDAPCVSFVTRIKHTSQQVLTQSLVHRYYNIKKAFTVSDDVKQLVFGSNIVVVDDVVTTGNTVREVVSVLKDAGATTVYVVGFARD